MRVRLVGLAVAVLSLLTAADASAYCLRKYTGFKKFARWTKIPVPYKVSSNLTDANILAAIDKAFQTWAAVKCSRLAFTKAGTFDIKTSFQQPPQGSIYIFWYDQANSASYPTGKQFAAYSFTAHNNVGGLAYGSIAVNGFGFKWNHTGGDAQKGILDVQNELIYLIGLVIGLTDSNKSSASVMKPQIAYGDTSRHTLKQDDIDAVVWLYATDATCKAPAPDASGCSSGSPVTPPVGDAGINPPASDSGTIPPPTEQGVVLNDGGGSGGNKDGGGSGGNNDGGGSGGNNDGGGSGGNNDGGGSGGCTSSAQCGDGMICTAAGQCVPLGSGGDGNDDGCCRVSHARGESVPLLTLLGLALLVALSRRRWRGRPRDEKTNARRDDA